MVTLNLTHAFAQVHGFRMHYAQAGAGPLVLLLHGFPEFWYGWRQQIPALAEAFTVVAPDLRGYNQSEKPAWGYELDVLAADVVGLLDALDAKECCLVGHDWGGMIAWYTAMSYPQRVRRLSILNAPHPTLFREQAWRNPRQLLRSWYIGFFQLPLLPEVALRANDYAAIERMLRAASTNPAAFSDADIVAYKDAISVPGALTAALNYYRRLPASRMLRFGTVPMPTQLIWGEQDVALGVELLDGLEQLVPNLEVRRIPEAGHFVQHDAPELVNNYLLEFLART